jgi:hypothetical protein
VEVLLKVYAKCIDGDAKVMNERIDTALGGAAMVVGDQGSCHESTGGAVVPDRGGHCEEA